MIWADPTWFLLAALGLLPLAWGRRRPRWSWPNLAGFGPGRSRVATWLRRAPLLLMGGAIACLALAMARPQSPIGRVRVAGRGVTIVAVLDRSSSMKTADFPGPDGPAPRLEAARATLARFVAGRADDLVGLVAFANYPDVIAAPTLDQRFLAEAIAAVRPAGPLDDGTNIGDALAVALGMARQAATVRKVVVLLTDGHNAPAVPRPVPPDRAASLARDLGITLHTIAIGRAAEGHGPDPGPAPDEGPDLPLLKRLAELGGGRSFQAADAQALDAILATIDELEKSPVSGTIRTLYRERFAPWAGAAFALLALEIIVWSGRLRHLPG